MGAISSRLVGDDDKNFPAFLRLMNSSRAQARVNFDEQKNSLDFSLSQKRKKKRSSLSSLFFFLLLSSFPPSTLDDNTPRQINHARKSDRLVRIVVHSKERRDGT
jgi:hypothetical protein